MQALKPRRRTSSSGSGRRKIFLDWLVKLGVLYHFELQMAGVILLTAMAAGAIAVWLRRRRLRREMEAGDSDALDV